MRSNGDANTAKQSATNSTERLEVTVHKALFDKIRFGVFELGQKLPTEAELCEEYSVSRPVIRAALAKLRYSGLVVSRRGAGSFVNSGVPTSSDGGYTSINSISDISTFFKFRRVIETTSIELATANASAEGVSKLRSIVAEMKQVLAQGGETKMLDLKFHKTIAELSDNQYLVETMEMLQPHMIFVGNFVRSLGMTGERKTTRMIEEHTAIVDAIASGDSKKAAETINRHLDSSERRIFKGES